MERINVTKSFLPPIEEFQEYVHDIWERAHLTNQGPLVQEFESKIKAYLQVEDFHFVANGTTALQLALRALDVTGEVITTPFTYVATTSSILWEHCKPVFVDIDPQTLCIDPDKIEAAITEKTQAIMPVHVFGIPCDVEKIEKIAKKHKLKVIYDAAHAFGVEYKGKSLFDFGDIATCSFHSTKLFHTIEGGCLIIRDKLISEKTELMKRFGHDGDEHKSLGINAKVSEFHAAMGLVNLKYVDDNIQKRRRISEQYDSELNTKTSRPIFSKIVKRNYAYYPVLFSSESHMHRVKAKLEKMNIFPRRYFYPSLNKLPYLHHQADCPTSEDIASRILCLPLYAELTGSSITKISEVVNS
jgi:dTDP-4-amino-4,6-dideoxygalactose transaminase